MNGTLKLGGFFAGSAFAVLALWLALGLPMRLLPIGNRYQLWFASLVFSIALLTYTLELTRRNLVRLVGVAVLLAVLISTLAISSDTAFDRSNLFELLSRQGALGIITIGAALIILTGGIDLSIGSVVGLSAVAFGTLMEMGVAPIAALALVLALGVAVGLTNGLLVTQLRLQAFLVTLCGMFVFRGFAREINKKQTGLVLAKENHPEMAESLDAMRALLVGKTENGALEFPAMLVVMLLLASIVAVILHKSAHGRYWFAIGYNDRAARYAGIGVERQRLAVFVIGSTLAAFAGVLLLLNTGTADPTNAGGSLELYAITAAVLGGVSLKGGECTAIGLVLGALVQPIINNLMTFLEIRQSAEPWVIGMILLLGTIADELIRRDAINSIRRYFLYLHHRFLMLKG